MRQFPLTTVWCTAKWLAQFWNGLYKYYNVIYTRVESLINTSDMYTCRYP